MQIDSSVFIYDKKRTNEELKKEYLLSDFNETHFINNNKILMKDILSYDNIFINGTINCFYTFKLEEYRVMGISDLENSTYKEKELKITFNKMIIKKLEFLINKEIYTLEIS